jgi:hypothetical protein
MLRTLKMFIQMQYMHAKTIRNLMSMSLWSLARDISSGGIRNDIVEIISETH